MVHPMAGDEGARLGPLERVQEVLALEAERRAQLKRDGAALAHGICAGTVRETICAMAVIARSSELLKFSVGLSDDDFERLVGELLGDQKPDWNDPDDAKAYALRSGHARLVTCNGLTLVFRESGGTRG